LRNALRMMKKVESNGGEKALWSIEPA
jgi:hypothetical protein